MASTQDPYAALRFPNFRRWMPWNGLEVMGMTMQATVVDFEIYERTHRPEALALVGLVQVVPVVFLALPAGNISDRFDRRWVLIISLLLVTIASLGLLATSSLQWHVGWMYLFLLCNGMARAFLQPAKSSFFPSLVTLDVFPNAVTWGMTVFQLASVLGMSLGGFFCSFAPWVYAYHALSAITFASVIYTLRPVTTERKRNESMSVASLLEGVRFLHRQPIVLAAVLLDMFAVLAGGCKSLLPIFRKDILHIPGDFQYGLLTSASAVGALAMAVALAHLPPIRNAGNLLLSVVVGFGIVTIGFGLSTSFWLSLTMLLVSGALDNISVVIRHSLVQMHTPDVLRGRVSAVNGMCISISNELGDFESGLVTKALGPVNAVVVGGIGTILTAAITYFVCPQLRRYDRLTVSEPAESEGNRPIPEGDPALTQAASQLLPDQPAP